MFYTFTDKNGVEIVSHSHGDGSPADFFQLISFEEIWNSAAKEHPPLRPGDRMLVPPGTKLPPEFLKAAPEPIVLENGLRFF